MDKNIVSFNEYRKKKQEALYGKDNQEDIFNKDLREQTDFLESYMFHRAFNSYKLNMYCLFQENHILRDKNPNSGFAVCYDEKQMETNTKSIINAIEWLNRRFILIPAANKTFRELGEDLTGIPHTDNFKVRNSFKDVLLNSEYVVVLQSLSQLKASKQDKIAYARSFIKILDDSHFDHIHPKADLIFVDDAKFLQDAWS